jgi:prolipoprotein diacylglyceryltransferase
MTIDLNPSAFGVALLPWTTLLTFVGAAGAITWMMRRASMLGLAPRATYGIALRTTLWAIFGARLVHVIENGSYYVEVPFQAFYLWSGGQSLWGALIFGAGGALWHAKRRGATLPAFGDALTLAGLATLAVGRFGDFLAGERIGTGTSLPWAITYANEGSVSFGAGATHPIALYEALLAVALVAMLLRFRRRITPGWIIDLAFVGLAIGRFIIGFATVERAALGLGPSQWVALLILIVVGAYMLRRSNRTRILVPRSEHHETGDTR